MKYNYKHILAAITLILLGSCADNSLLDYQVAEPESNAQLKYLNDYDVLKSYVDRTANPNFKLGAGVSLAEYNSKGVVYRLANSNFDEITAGYEMKHMAVVQRDGTLALDDVTSFLAAARAAGTSVFGHTLCWHSNQNAGYLNGLIQPALEASIITNSDFETSADGWGGWGGTRGRSDNGQGYGNQGYCYWFANPTAGDYWGAQTVYNFTSAMKSGSKYILSFKVKASVAGTIRAEVQTTTDYSSESFGTFNVGTEWQKLELSVTPTKDTRTRFIFDHGDFAGKVYVDDVTLCRVNPNGGSEKTDDQKKQIIDNQLESWISGMVGACKSYVKAWDVVNEPMSDWPDQTQLKTGVGKTLATDEFYWQDYLGKDYAVKAITYARKYGNATDKLFINDYGLENADQKKCLGLIQYIKYVESKGVTVDGIGTQMHVTLGITSIDGIRSMLTNLAATGKLIKISELDMGIQPAGSTAGLKTSDVTFDQLKLMSDFYKSIVKAYFELIPAAQRYGITQWAITDSPSTSSWRPNEPIGLWTLDYSRKPAYAGFADGLSGK